MITSKIMMQPSHSILVLLVIAMTLGTQHASTAADPNGNDEWCAGLQIAPLIAGSYGYDATIPVGGGVFTSLRRNDWRYNFDFMMFYTPQYTHSEYPYDSIDVIHGPYVSAQISMLAQLTIWRWSDGLFDVGPEFGVQISTQHTYGDDQLFRIPFGIAMYYLPQNWVFSIAPRLFFESINTGFGDDLLLVFRVGHSF